MFPPNRRMTYKDERLILGAYQDNKTALQILDLLGGRFKTTKTVYDVLRKYGMERRDSGRKYRLDHFYFAEIDRPEKAYILGLMITDGWIRSDRSEVGLQLVEEDRGVIEKVKSEWDSERKLLTLQKGKFVGANGKTYQSRPMVRIAVESVRMKEDLLRYGVFPSKSGTTWLPLLDKHMSHLIRGIIDGDGSIYSHGVTGQPCVRFLGSPYLVAQISLFLTMILGISYRNPSLRSNSDFLSYVDYSNFGDVRSIISYAYYNPVISIERKLNRAKDIIHQLSR